MKSALAIMLTRDKGEFLGIHIRPQYIADKLSGNGAHL